MRCKITYPICFIQDTFLSLIRGSYSYGEGTGLRPGERTAAPPLASKATTRSAPPFEQYFKCKVKNVS